MNKAEIISAIAEKHGTTKVLSGEILDTILEEIANAVADGEKVSLAGFGTFERAHRAARTGRNPQTGEALEIDESYVPRFKPLAAFKEAVKG